VKPLSQEYPITVVCRVFGASRSSLYYKPVEPKANDEVKAQIAQLAAAHPTYGYRRITAMLHRGGHPDNNKRVRRLMSEMGLAGKCPKKRCRTTDRNHPLPRYRNRVEGLVVERPEQLWVGDITYVKLGCEFVYLAVLMDGFTRSIRGWQLARSMEMELTLVALKRALARGRPDIHHSDQGVQYAAKEYTRLLEEQGIEISMAEVGEAWQNGYAERTPLAERSSMMRTIKEEEVELSEYRNFEEAYQEIGRSLDDVYTKKRIHSSLGYLTPLEFENQWRERKTEENRNNKEFN
jgi:putative transposase